MIQTLLSLPPPNISSLAIRGLYPTLPTFLPANPYYQPKTDAGTDTFAAGTAEMMGSVAGKQVDLERHMVTHYKEKPHKCPDCDIRFSRKDAMRRHLKMESSRRGGSTTSPEMSEAMWKAGLR
ncbi:hypothetical protein BC829DRAFT_383008 [Chytridium lagenaria]|nr:hypothetical protein BC829DRAFT_383008 [Chytridium lagenaria]